MGQALTYERPHHRVHLSGDPKHGWIGEIHDASEGVTWSSGGTADKPEPHPATAEVALDAVHAAYQKVKGKAVDEWESLRQKFLAEWRAVHGASATPPPAPDSADTPNRKPAA